MKIRVWNAHKGFGTVIGSYFYAKSLNYRVIWDKDPSFTDDVLASSVECIE